MRMMSTHRPVKTKSDAPRTNSDVFAMEPTNPNWMKDLRCWNHAHGAILFYLLKFDYLFIALD